VEEVAAGRGDELRGGSDVEFARLEADAVLEDDDIQLSAPRVARPQTRAVGGRVAGLHRKKELGLLALGDGLGLEGADDGRAAIDLGDVFDLGRGFHNRGLGRERRFGGARVGGGVGRVGRLGCDVGGLLGVLATGGDEDRGGGDLDELTA
jgi:hypothetical protein